MISGTVKNISNGELKNLVINGMAFKDRGKRGFHYAVADIFEDEKVSITSIAAGETKNFTITLTDINWDGLKYNGVIFVQSITGKKMVYQSLFIK